LAGHDGFAAHAQDVGELVIDVGQRCGDGNGLAAASRLKGPGDGADCEAGGLVADGAVDNEVRFGNGIGTCRVGDEDQCNR
jgi:hypothetical protein